MVYFGFAGVALFWMIDTLIDTYLFQEGNLIQQIFHPEPMEIYFRGAIGTLFIIFGLFGQRILNQRRKAELLLADSNRELEEKVWQRTVQLEEANVQLKKELEDRRRNDERINYLSFHDKLTGLYNRAYFEEELARLDNERFLPVSLIIGDVNSLKLINDAFGHQQGDRFLVKAAEIIHQSCRKSDIVARWGGDEFAVLLPNTSSRSAVKICDKIRQSCRKSSKKPIQLSIALGTATKQDKNQDIERVLKNAEDWMYQYKMMEGKTVRSRVLSSLEKTLWETAYETEEHSKHLQKHLLKMALELKLSDAEIDDLMLLASFHDIGKIAISNTILSKPGRLTPKEWDAVKKHSEIGYRIALATPEITAVADSILHHHEWWDGTGYPRGLKGEKIPLASRLLSIADAYDVKRSVRPYKIAKSRTQALREMKEGTGRQFDPHLVKIFLKLESTEKPTLRT
jgi:diguanylate cyclase (GGDEF)-like protein